MIPFLTVLVGINSNITLTFWIMYNSFFQFIEQFLSETIFRILLLSEKLYCGFVNTINNVSESKYNLLQLFE